MKKVYRHIKFEWNEGYEQWECFNKKSDDPMGSVEFYDAWSQYVIEFKPKFVFNDRCLMDVAHFLSQLNKEKKLTQKKTPMRNA